MQWIGLKQPDVPINPGAFIEPTFFHRRIDAHDNHVIAAVAEELGEVPSEARVATLFAPQVMSIDPNLRVSEDAVELDADPAAKIG